MLLNSCNDGVVTFTGGNSKVRFLYLSSRTSTATVYYGSNILFENAQHGKPTTYSTFPAGLEQTIEVRDKADSTIYFQKFKPQKYVFAIDANYTIIATGSDRPLYLYSLDSLVSPVAGKPTIRFINVSDSVLSASLKLNSVPYFKNGIEQNDMSKYLTEAPGGNVTIEALDNDFNKVVATTNTTFQNDKVYYVLLYNKPNSKQLEVSVISTTETN